MRISRRAEQERRRRSGRHRAQTPVAGFAAFCLLSFYTTEALADL